MTALNEHSFRSSVLFGLSSASVKKVGLIREGRNRDYASDTAFQVVSDTNAHFAFSFGKENSC